MVSIFRSLFNSKSEKIYSDFVEVLNDFGDKIEREIKPQNSILVIHWLSIVPRLFFEMIFVKDEKGEVYLEVLRNATENKGRECAFITQAFVLWNLEKFLKNDKVFKEEMGFSIENLEEIIKIILGHNNKVIYYLNYYRERFDLKKFEIDPRDVPIFYVWDICDTLITNKKVLKKTMQEWNDDWLEKTSFVLSTFQFFNKQKEIAPKLSKNS